MEAIGALASISQLLEYGLKIANSITEACRRIEGAKSRLQYYNSQIQQLTDIALLIQRNEQLQIPVVCAQVDSTVIQAKALLYTIQTATAEYTEGSRNKRYWKAVRATKESQISAGFERLEQEKGALILCVSVVQASAISTISSNVDIMSTNIKTLINESKDSRLKHLQHRVRGEKIAIFSEPKSLAQSLEGDSDDSYVDKKSLVRIKEQKSKIKRTALDAPIFFMDHSSHRENNQKREAHHVYSGVTAVGKAPQLNGDFKPETASNNLYKDITATGGGRQVNGNAGGLKATGSSQGHDYHGIEVRGEGSWQVNGDLGEKTTMQEVNSFFMIKE